MPHHTLKFKNYQAIGIIFLLMLSIVSCSYFQKEKNEINVILQLRDMSDMALVEFVVSKVVKVNDVPGWYKYGDRKLLISCKARIKAGINMAEITDDDVEISGTSITLKIPRASVISLNMDPESIREEYVKTGFFRSTFTNEDKYKFLQQAEAEIKEGIPEMGILSTAEANAIAFFESWLRLLGFEEIHVVLKSNNHGMF